MYVLVKLLFSVLYSKRDDLNTLCFKRITIMSLILMTSVGFLRRIQVIALLCVTWCLMYKMYMYVIKGILYTNSFNCRRLRDQKKRLDKFHWLKSSQYGIKILQETHCTAKDESRWENGWGVKIIFFLMGHHKVKM